MLVRWMLLILVAPLLLGVAVLQGTPPPPAPTDIPSSPAPTNTPPPPAPTGTPPLTVVATSPPFERIFEAVGNNDLGTAGVILWKELRWLGIVIFVVIVSILAIFGLYFARILAWMGSNLPGLRPGGREKIDPTLDWASKVDTPRLLTPEPSVREEMFVKLKLKRPPKKGDQAQILQEEEFESLSQAMQARENGRLYPAFVLLGEPGSGKSTLLCDYSYEADQNQQQDPQAPKLIFVSLNANRYDAPEEYLLRAWQLKGYAQSFEAAMRDGEVLLLADGLNEIDRSQYRTVTNRWDHFLNLKFLPNGNRAIIASRRADYGEYFNLPRLEIQELDETRIQEFLGKRFPDKASMIWKNIQDDLEEGRDELYDLARIPFWLVLMGQVATTPQGLPTNRAGLADRFVDNRLNSELEKDKSLVLSSTGWKPLKDGLTRVAWYGLFRGQNVPLPRQKVEKLFYDGGRAQQVIPAHAFERIFSCGLLEGDGATLQESKKLTFKHQLFQEYFAARKLSAYFRGKKGRFAFLNRPFLWRRLWRIPWKDWKFIYRDWGILPEPPSSNWKEATIIAAGFTELDSEVDSAQLISEVMRHNPVLASECIHKLREQNHTQVRQQVIQRLESWLDHPLPLTAWRAWEWPGWLVRRLPAAGQERQAAQALLPVAVRLAAARQLGLFEERPEMTDRRYTLPSGGECILPDWAEVPAGAFRMGISDDDREILSRQGVNSYEDESPHHEVYLSEFAIARFPVSVAEYRCFMNAGGYQEDGFWEGEDALGWLKGELDYRQSYDYQYWVENRPNIEAWLPQLAILVEKGDRPSWHYESYQRELKIPEAEREERWRERQSAKRDEDGRARQPWLWEDRAYTNPAQPVTGVCWYEARAYAAWLSQVTGKKIRLPSEAQWEKAARGVNGRLWPWGNTWDARHCNTLEGRIGYPTPRGVYPHGASPCKALDMVGNVWEWCQDWYDPGIYSSRVGQEVRDPLGPETGTLRVVRGGSWFSYRDLARCACRNRSRPDSFLDDLGFRVVCAPN